MNNIGIQVTLNGPKPEKIPISEVRIEIRKIEEQFYGRVATQSELTNLNRSLDQYVNKPYNLIIKAELINNNVKLYGYNDDSKAVLDPNCGIEYISKTRIRRR